MGSGAKEMLKMVHKEYITKLLGSQDATGVSVFLCIQAKGFHATSSTIDWVRDRATPSEALTSNREAVGVPREWGQSTRSRGSRSNRPPLGPAGRGHRKRKPGTPVRSFFRRTFTATLPIMLDAPKVNRTGARLSQESFPRALEAFFPESSTV